MSEMLTEYLTHREQGHGPHAALTALSRRFDLDKDTVGRVIERAFRDLDRPAGRVKNLHEPPRSPRRSLARAGSPVGSDSRDGGAS
jgi:hypothetical protein